MTERNTFHTLTSAEVKDRLVPLEVKASRVEEIAGKLGEIVFGQDEACHALARRVAIFEAGLSNPQRPLGVVYFLGGSGTGKTEMSRALANYLFGSPNSIHLRIIDCAEFHDYHTIARLTGSPPGYVGYGDTPLVDNAFLKSRNVLVFDEVEKAHPRLWEVLLSIMEEGRIRARVSRGGGYHAGEEELNFSLSFIILTSNVGAEGIQRAQRGSATVGFVKKPMGKTIQEIGKEALKKHYASMPEFLGRIDDIICFEPLKREHYVKIYNKFIDEINFDLKSQFKDSPFLTSTIEFQNYVLDKLDYEYGARDMRHILDRELVEKVADIFGNVFGKYKMENMPIVADYEDGKIVFYSTELVEQPPKEEKPQESPKPPRTKKKEEPPRQEVEEDPWDEHLREPISKPNI